MKKLLLSFILFTFCCSINAQWTSQPTGFSAASRGLDQIVAVDANIVWAKAYDGSGAGAVVQEFTRTSNGGDTWTAGIINVGDTALGINNIAPINATTAWVSAVNGPDGTGSVVYKTTDGGATWNQQLSNGFISTGSFVNFVHFFDANIGFAAGDPIGSGVGEFEIWRTTDGGATWTLLPGTSIANPLSGEYGYNGGNVVIGNTVWMPTNRGRILKSTDQGLTWTVTQVPGLTDFGGTAQSGRMSFSDANIGCIVRTIGTSYAFSTTSNGGTTWTAFTAFTGTRRLLTYIPGTTTIVATSQAAPVGTSVSTNNGSTWVDVESGEQRGVSVFLNATTGWCAGFSQDPFTDGVFKLTGSLSNETFLATNSIKIYPNPATNIISISGDQLNNTILTVADITGKVLINKSLSNTDFTLDISGLTSGTYFFTIASDSNRETIKIIKN